KISRRGFKGRLKIKPVRLTLNLKVGNHRIIRRSVNTRMDVREMRCIDKVFDHARGAGFPALGTVEKSVIVRIFNFPEFRYRRSWLVQTHPYKAVLFLSPVDHNPRLLWDSPLMEYARMHHRAHRSNSDRHTRGYHPQRSQAKAPIHDECTSL